MFVNGTRSRSKSERGRKWSRDGREGTKKAMRMAVFNVL
jgi:hypothetical protein